MRSTFQQSDVVLLLKDISGLVEPLPAEIRERHIQNGTHYCEMLPLEYEPSAKYMVAYKTALKNYAGTTAAAVASLAEKIYALKGDSLVIVSLARAGTPIGVLIKRYLEKKYRVQLIHYSISIIRGRGIDKNALDYILAHHNAEAVQFVDGWIGKGAILGELVKELRDYPQLSPDLAVVSDPANLTDLCGTHEDFLIPSSCLNATVAAILAILTIYNDIRLAGFAWGSLAVFLQIVFSFCFLFLVFITLIGLVLKKLFHMRSALLSSLFGGLGIKGELFLLLHFLHL